MREVGKAAAACLVLVLTLALAGAAASGAPTPGAPSPAAPAPDAGAPAAASPEAPRSPLTDVAEPQAAPAPEGAEAKAADAATGLSDDTRWGLLVRGGYFGLPDVVANKLYRQHPKVAGHTYGGELRYHGDGGGRGVASVGLAVDQANVDGEGLWQTDENDSPKAFGGEIDMLCVTLTGYWSMFPRWYAHPYVGFGLGVAHLKGDYLKDNELTTVDAWIPALHVPVGLAFELGKHLQVSLEARVLNGIAAGGALQARF